MFFAVEKLRNFSKKALSITQCVEFSSFVCINNLIHTQNRAFIFLSVRSVWLEPAYVLRR